MSKAQTITSTMRQAFIDAFGKSELKPTRTVNQVLSSLERNQGAVKRPAWNANLTFKTAQKLKLQGILTA